MKYRNRILSLTISAAMLLQLLLPISIFAENAQAQNITIIKDSSYNLPSEIDWDVTNTTVDTSEIGYQIFTGTDTESNPVTYRINVGEYEEVFTDDLEAYEKDSTAVSAALADGGTFTMNVDNRKIKEIDGNNVLSIGPAASEWNTLSWAPLGTSGDFRLSFKMKVGKYVLDGVHTSDSKHYMTRVNMGKGSSKTDVFQLRMRTKGTDQKTYDYTEMRLVGKKGADTDFNINLDEVLGSDIIAYTDSVDEDGNTVKSMNNWLEFEFYGNETGYTLYINDVLIKDNLAWGAVSAMAEGLKYLSFAKRDGEEISNAVTYTDDVSLSKLVYVTGSLPEILTDTVELGEDSSLELTKTISLLCSDGSYKNYDVSYTVDSTAVGVQTVYGLVEGFKNNGENAFIPIEVSVEEAPVIITSIPDIVHSAYIGESYTLPETVTANMSDSTTTPLAVEWNGVADTSAAGKYEFFGSVDGYDPKVKLTLTVKNAVVRETHIAVGEEFYLPEKLNGKEVTWNESGYTDENNKVDTSNFGRLHFTGIDSECNEINYTVYVSRTNEVFSENMQSEAYDVNTKVERTEPPYYLNLDGDTSMLVYDEENADNKTALMLPNCSWGNFSVVSENKTVTDYSFKGRVRIDGNEKDAGLKFIIYNLAKKEVAGINFSLDTDTSLIRMRNGVRASVADGGNPSTVKAQNNDYILFENDGSWMDFEVFVDVHNKNYDVYSNGYLLREDLEFNIPGVEDGAFKSANAFSVSSSISAENKTYVDDLVLTEYTYVIEDLPEALSDSVTRGATAEREQTVLLELNDGTEEAFSVRYSIDPELTGTQYVTGKINGFTQEIPVTVEVDARAIKSIGDISGSAFAGTGYELPSKVTAVMEDDSEKDVTVSWSSLPDLSRAGEYVITGSVSGYDGEVRLNLTVINDYPVSVDVISHELTRYEPFTLPEKVIANMFSGTQRECSVDWMGNIAATDKVGEITYIGYIKGYQPDVSENPVAVSLTLKIAPVEITGFRNNNPKILLKRGADMPEKIVCMYSNGMSGFERVIWDEAALGDGSLDSYTVTGRVDGFAGEITATVSFTDVPVPNLTDGLDTDTWPFGDEKYPVGSSLLYGKYETNNSPFFKSWQDPENPDNRVLIYQNSDEFPEKYNGIYCTMTADEAKSGMAVMEMKLWIPRKMKDYLRVRLQASTNMPLAVVDLYGENQRIRDVNGAFPVEEWFRLTVVADSSNKADLTYDIYINDILTVEDAPWATQPSETNGVGKNLQKISFRSEEPNFAVYIDDVNLYMLNDTFKAAIESIAFDSMVADGKLELPLSYSDGTSISWTSSDENLITTDGTVTRPKFGSGTKTVVMTATLTKDMGCFEAKETKEYAFTVKPLGATDKDMVLEVAETLNPPSVITDDVEFKTSVYGAEITWETSRPDVLDSKGRVFNPKEDTPVKIIANIKYGNETGSRKYNVIVKHSDEPSDKQKVRAAIKNVNLPAKTNTNLSLPSSEGKVEISWVSSNISVISHKGVLTSNRNRTDVVMTAIFTIGEYREEEKYTVTVEASKNESSSSSGGGSGSYKSNVVQTVPTVPAVPTVKVGGFTDISDYSWAAEAIGALAETGVIKGVSNESFAPGKEILREEFAAMMVRLMKYNPGNGKNVFEDVDSDSWFLPEINAAYENGIISGIGNNLFGVGKPISRQDMAVILYNVANKSGFVQENTSQATFEDYKSINDYAKEAVNFLFLNKILNGSDGKMLPLNNATRAEAAKMIYEFLNVFYSEKLK